MKKINFENAPSTNTPLSAENLNLMQSNIEEIGAVISATEPTTNEKVWFRKSKNLFNINNISSFGNCIINSDGTITSYFYSAYYSYINLKYLNDVILKNKGKTLTLSMDVTSTNNIGIIIYGTRTASSENYQQVINAPSSCSLTIADDFTSIDRLEIRFNAKSSTFTDTTTIASNIQLELGTATEYEPYVEKAIYTKNTNGVFEQFTDIETITNENGTAIKYPDGTMICTGELSLVGQISNATGSGYYKYFSPDTSFPVSFIDKPRITVTPNQEWCMVGMVKCNEARISNVTLFVLNADTTEKTYTNDYIAIGRWK